jgi:CheY-like chemotaxis protein
MGERSDRGAGARQDLAAAVHETTNALTVILGWIERARVACADTPEALAALRRAGRYTRAARDGMRRAIGAAVPEAAPEGAMDLVIRTLDDLALEARREGVALAWTSDDDAQARLLPHPDEAWQVLTNLLLNAITATPRGGQVSIGLTAATDSVCFTVHDQGPGVEAALRDSLFDAGLSTRVGGAGIGLRHSHSLAAALGGHLRLADGDGGATFELVWPSTTEPSRPHHPPSEQPAATSIDGTRVLLLEDDAAVVELLELSLGARGAAVTSVSSAEAFGAELDSGRYDVVLVDLSPLSPGQAPDEDSSLDDTIERARRANSNIGVVVISGSVTVEPRPGIAWVRKPFELRELIEAIVRHRP